MVVEVFCERFQLWENFGVSDQWLDWRGVRL